MKILHLTLHKKWFDMILSGEKREEYREIKPYWIKRLQQDFDAIQFRNGYNKNSRKFLVYLTKISTGKANIKWIGDDYKDSRVFILHLGEKVPENGK